MKLHADFKPLAPGAVSLVRLLNESPLSRDGAFSRIVPLDEVTVLKASSCTATNLLFDELRLLSKYGRAPQALPIVLQDFGTVAQDRDGVQYRLWTVERLFDLSDEDGMRLARTSPLATLDKSRKSAGLRRRTATEDLLTALSKALTQEQAMAASSVSRSSWKTCARVASAMAVRTDGPLRKAFLFLESFIRRHQVELDLLTQGNILLDMHGQPVLSDPVCADWSGDPPAASPLDTPAGPASDAEPEEEQFYLLAQAPVALHPGFRLELRWQTSFGLNQERARQLAREYAALGLEPLVLAETDERRLALLQQPSEYVSGWNHPVLLRQFQADAYVSLFGKT